MVHQTYCSWRPRVWLRRWRSQGDQNTLRSIRVHLRGSKKNAALRLLELLFLLLFLEKLLCLSLPLLPLRPHTTTFDFLYFTPRVL